MKKKDRVVTVLTLLTVLAMLCGNSLWLEELLQGRRDEAVLWNAAAGVLSILLFLALHIVIHRRQRSTEEEHEAEMDALKIAHRKELEELQTQHRQEMESFRSTLSHSLRMPVAIIQGYAELLAGDMVSDPETRHDYLEKIIQRSQYMTDAMSRHFYGGEAMDSSKLSYSDVDLLGLIRQAGMDMQTAAAEQSVTIQVLAAEESLVVRADAYLLNRALFNLLENSLKYMGRPGAITIRVQRMEKQVSITVRDDGMGLSPEETEHIFERCFRGSNHADLGGHGYGLYLVKQTVEAHGGQVAAQSDLGQGMSITMTLPL